MSAKRTVDELLAKPMSRKVFLGQVGALFLAVVGVSAVLKSLGATGGQTRSQGAVSGQSPEGEYESSAYGG